MALPRPRSLLALVALGLGALTLIPTGADAQDDSALMSAVDGGPTFGHAGWYEALRELEPDPGRGALVQGLTLTRDVGTFSFDEGQLNLLRDIDGRTVGLAFRGSGRFRMTVPDPVEQAQLERRLEVSAIDQPIESAVLFFTDFTLSELAQAGIEWTPHPVPRDMERDVDEAREYVTNGDGWVRREVLLPLVNRGPGFFWAHVAENRGDPLAFRFDPHQFEEVALMEPTERNKRFRTVVAFHRMADYQSGRSVPEEALDVIRVTHYDLSTRITGGLDLEGRAQLTVERQLANYDWVPFSLHPELEVESVAWADGTPVEHARPDESSDLWIDLGGQPEGENRLVIEYEGDILDRPQGLWIRIASHINWFPVYQFYRPAPYRVTFRSPDDLVLTTVGTKVAETRDGDEVVATWETDPVRLLTFNIGDFDRFESAPPAPGDPALTVLINEGAHKRYSDMAAERGYIMFEQQDMAEMVAIDLRAAFSFFNDVYGPTTVRSFTATEIPFSHGEAYAGLVMLAWNTFQWTSSQGFDEMFRAHEVAHQWWGIGVRPATYRDRWISEGFSEFSGWWYAARARGSVDLYYRRLKETRERILERRDKAPPIALGTRVGTSEYPRDYQLTIYHKGAWVLHMLRTLLTDHDTGSDDRFTEVMRTFYERHRDGTASTASFQAVVEEVVGAPMGWFFQAWVYGNHIPTYRFSHKYEEQPDGSVIATVRVRQEDVPDDFQMLVPVMLDFGAEGTATVMVTVAGPESEQQLPVLPRVPDDIVFNPFESVLAETRTEDWRER